MTTANSNQVSNLIAHMMTEFNENLSPILNTANNQYEGDFKNEVYASGGVVNIKIPGYPTVTTGIATSPQAIQDLVVAYTLTPEDIYNTAYEYDIQSIDYFIVGGDKALTKDAAEAIVDNYGRPTYLALEQQLEVKAYSLFLTNSYYTPIDDISKLSGVNNFSTVQSVTTMANWLQLNADMRTLMMNLNDGDSVSSSLQNSFVSAVNTKITLEGWVGGSAEKGRLAGLDCMESNVFLPFVAGALGGRTDITVGSVADDGLSIVLNVGGTSSAKLIKAGDRFVFPTIKWVQPVGKSVLAYNVSVVAAIDANGDGAGHVTLTLNYPLMASGWQANVSALPAPGAAVQCFPSRNINVMYTKSGFFAATLPLHDVYGAVNSDNMIKGKRIKVKSYMQGSVTAGSNIYRTSQQVPMKVMTPYVIELPSKVA